MHSTAIRTAAASPALSTAMRSGAPWKASGNIDGLGLVQNVTAGATIFCEGDLAETVYEVTSGMVRLSKSLPDGRRQITGFLAGGYLLGLSSKAQYLYTAEAVTDVRLRRFSRRRFEGLMDEVPGLARRVLAAMSNELCIAQDQMLLLGRKSADEKVASFLITLADSQGSCDGKSVFVPMKRSDMADYLGLTVETVSRALARLKHEQLINVSQHAYIDLLNRGRLEELAAGEAGHP